MGDTPLSYVPLYELWVSFRPQYHFNEHWSLRARFDYTKEATNAEQTTYSNEDVFGDIWTDLAYEAVLPESVWKNTVALATLRAIWPTSKISQASGTYFVAGPRVGVSHIFELRGLDAPWLSTLLTRAGVLYLHQFAAATTPNDYGNFGYVRQNIDDQSFLSDAISGQTLVEHELTASLFAQLFVTQKLSLEGVFILQNQWHYAPTSGATIPITGGTVVLAPPVNDNQYTENTWFTFLVNYDVLDELTLSLGYYNLANALAPDGQGRSLFGSENIWWSPGARFFFDVTANLDAIFDDTQGHKYSKESARGASPKGTAAR